MLYPRFYSDEVVKDKRYYKDILSSIWSITSSTIVLEFIWNINLLFLGTLCRSEVIAAVGLADLIIYFSGCYFVIGLNEGFTTLASRAFAAEHYKLVGSYLSKAVFLIFSFFILQVIIAIYSDKILILLWQDEEVSVIAREYLLCLLPVIFFEYVFDLLRSYLNSMEIYHIHSTITFVTTILHPFFCWLLLPYGYKGIALATGITKGLNFIVILLYIIINNPIPQSWSFKFGRIFKGFKKYVSNVFPVAFSIFFDPLIYGVKTLIIGSFKNPIMLAAHVITTNFYEIFLCIFIAANYAINEFAANAIKERHIQKCKLLTKFSYIFGLVGGILFMLLFSFIPKYIFEMYTRDYEVLSTMVYLTQTIAFIAVFDYMQQGLQGLAQGVGLGDECFYIGLVCYWVIGIPTIIILAVHYNLELFGVWLSYGITVFSLFIILSFFILRIHWFTHIKEKFAELLEDNKFQEKQEQEFYLELELGTQESSFRSY